MLKRREILRFVSEAGYLGTGEHVGQGGSGGPSNDGMKADAKDAVDANIAARITSRRSVFFIRVYSCSPLGRFWPAKLLAPLGATALR
jgi:hypothetical protein